MKRFQRSTNLTELRTNGAANRRWTMRHFWIVTGYLILFVQVAACASTTPPRRIADYLGPQSMEQIASTPLPPSPIHAGLMIVPDTSAPDAAPLLPDEALNRLRQRLQQELSQMTRV